MQYLEYIRACLVTWNTYKVRFLVVQELGTFNHLFFTTGDGDKVRIISFITRKFNLYIVIVHDLADVLASMSNQATVDATINLNLLCCAGFLIKVVYRVINCNNKQNTEHIRIQEFFPRHKGDMGVVG